MAEMPIGLTGLIRSGILELQAGLELQRKARPLYPYGLNRGDPFSGLYWRGAGKAV
jgi:hypothetical protein